MKEQLQNKNSSNFLNTDGGKTKSNAIETPSISMPKGGGAIKGIDEKFSVNAVNGTSSFSIPLPFSPARGASPELGLSYSSGAGNGIFGLGWNLNLGSIKRKTDKGLPQYLDTIDSDTFLFSEAEDLVPEFDKNTDGSFQKDEHGDYIFKERHFTDEGDSYTIRNYSPRIEGLFALIERWTDDNSGRIKWRVITKENTTTLFGWTDNSIISNPANPTKIYEWLPEFVFDDKGNFSQYLYKKEDSTGFDESLLHNRNRMKSGTITYTNLYLDKVLYGNKIPYKGFDEPFPVESDYFFQTVFDYGTTDIETESPENVNSWDFRPDAFSDYKAGFEIRTTRLCKRVLLYHVFEELAIKSDKSDKKTLIKSVNFEYDTSSEQDFTFLKSITSFGYIKKPDGSYSHKKLPPVEFEYQKHEWNKEIKTISSDDLVHAPAGLDEQQYQFTDLFNEGLSGILTEQANGWYYKHNLGNGQFEHAKLVSPKPSFAGLGGQLQLADLDGDGGKQLVNYGPEPRGYFELDDDNEWLGLRSFKALLNIDFGEPNTRMLDLNGDGKAEVVISEEHVFTWYASEGREGFSAARKTSKPFDEEEGPHIVFADAKQTIYLADMSGDGMTDIVRIRNGEVCYWPNLGYGKFGAKVALDNTPLFDHPDSFNPTYLRLADIDGSGTSDIIYLGKNKFTCWKNLSGNRFSTTPFEIDPFPEIHSQAKITVTDLLGNGVACIVWSSPLSKDANIPLKYIDLMNSKKPHIMVSYKNNLGKEVTLEYTPSTKFYLEDKLAGKPWITKLHFPVHCVSKTTTEDKISGYKFVSEYKYHHGYYDHLEREFRGFGMVEQTDAETFEHWKKGTASNITEEPLHQEPVVSKSWYHTGAFQRIEKILKHYAHEYWYEEMRRQGFDATHFEKDLPDARLTVAEGIDVAILDNLSVDEIRESQRACKGMMLRNEVFALDAIKSGNTKEAKKRELTPYTVATHNCKIQLIQPKGKNKHAVYGVLESEAISYEYERDAEDPRIAHHINVKVDDYGNVLESVDIVYPRRKADESLPDKTQAEQAKTTIIYTQNTFTNDVISEETYRLRLPSEVKTYELKHIPKEKDYYTPDDFNQILESTQEVGYEEFAPTLTSSYKRCIEHVRSIYLSDDLTTPLPLHQLGKYGLPYENYQLAYTPALLDDIFGDKVNDSMLLGGKFTHSEGDNNWWIRSGTVQYKQPGETLEDVQNRFFMPVSYTDPYGAVTEVTYYENYYLFIESTTDPLGNTEKVNQFNFRTLSPQEMKDINGNRVASLTDELGLIKAMAIMGKVEEADHLKTLKETTDAAESDLKNGFLNADNSVELITKGKELLKEASVCFVYDFENYMQHGIPPAVASISREQHYADNPDSSIQIGFEYSNGLGEVIMQKMQAEPGIAKRVNVLADNEISIEEINTAVESPSQLRWIGTGRTIKNNKGNPVKQYEPYFSVSWQYEDVKELVESSVTPIMYYDAIGRLVKTELPDGTFTKVEFDSWKQSTFDSNDTILESKWYDDRINRKIDEKLSAAGKNPEAEKEAAEKAAKHAKTPAVQHVDTLGRPVLSVEHNKNKSGDDEFYYTKATLDVEGNLRAVTDARGNKVMQYAYDMLGNLVFEDSMDAGKRWMLTNILSAPYLVWDENEKVDNEGNLQNEERIFQISYDILQRPTEQKLKINEQSWILIEKITYGESQPDPNVKNLRGQVYEHFDSSGLITNQKFDFKGNLLSASRQLTQTLDESIIDWNAEAPSKEIYHQHTHYDALNRMVEMQNWHLGTRRPGIYIPTYNERGLLQSESLSVDGKHTEAVKRIEYNAKGQKTLLKLGNGTSTRNHYDAETFRLIQLKTTKGNNAQSIISLQGNVSELNVLQNLYYTYDPVGNITQIVDNTYESVFFKNQQVEPKSTYEYDAIYRLAKATGREHHNANGAPGQFDQTPFETNFPITEQTLRNYRQYYEYDEVGNIIKMRHIANEGNWTRNYEYDTKSNRLLKTYTGNHEVNAIHYQYDTHGSMLNLGNSLDEYRMQWDYRDMLHTVNLGGGGTAHYQYDVQKERSRKYIIRNGNQREERIYLGGFERYRRWEGETLVEEIETHHLFAEEQRLLIAEHVLHTNNNNLTTGILYRYQYSNHLGSASLELDRDAQIISYEEYLPYGTSAYQSRNKNIKATAKRYRYTGMERDEETGMAYHSARYYLPWLGRWCSTDSIGIGGGLNLYKYAFNNTINFDDTSGMVPDSDVTYTFEGDSYNASTGMWDYENDVDSEINSPSNEEFINISDDELYDEETQSFNLLEKITIAGKNISDASKTRQDYVNELNNLAPKAKEVAKKKTPTHGEVDELFQERRKIKREVRERSSRNAKAGSEIFDEVLSSNAEIKKQGYDPNTTKGRVSWYQSDAYKEKHQLKQNLSKYEARAKVAEGSAKSNSSKLARAMQSKWTYRAGAGATALGAGYGVFDTFKTPIEERGKVGFGHIGALLGGWMGAELAGVVVSMLIAAGVLTGGVGALIALGILVAVAFLGAYIGNKAGETIGSTYDNWMWGN